MTGGGKEGVVDRTRQGHLLFRVRGVRRRERFAGVLLVVAVILLLLALAGGTGLNVAVAVLLIVSQGFQLAALRYSQSAELRDDVALVPRGGWAWRRRRVPRSDATAVAPAPRGDGRNLDLRLLDGEVVPLHGARRYHREVLEAWLAGRTPDALPPP